MKRIVLCGSMKLKEKIFEVEEYLKNKGYEVVTPKEFRVEMTKEDASKLHFDEIANKNTDIVLAVNVTKNGIENYIGPNTFAEIAMAFYFNKKIYVLNDIYEPYRDELEGWNVVALKGNLEAIQ
jgi:diphthamide synthase subunit DPH2